MRSTFVFVIFLSHLTSRGGVASLPIGVCRENSCLNLGQCLQLSSGESVCKCTPCYTGDICSDNVCGDALRTDLTASESKTNYRNTAIVFAVIAVIAIIVALALCLIPYSPGKENDRNRSVFFNRKRGPSNRSVDIQHQTDSGLSAGNTNDPHYHSGCGQDVVPSAAASAAVPAGDEIITDRMSKRVTEHPQMSAANTHSYATSAPHKLEILRNQSGRALANERTKRKTTNNHQQGQSLPISEANHDDVVAESPNAVSSEETQLKSLSSVESSCSHCGVYDPSTGKLHRRLPWDEVEMKRHGLLNSRCRHCSVGQIRKTGITTAVEVVEPPRPKAAAQFEEPQKPRAEVEFEEPQKPKEEVGVEEPLSSKAEVEVETPQSSTSAVVKPHEPRTEVQPPTDNETHVQTSSPPTDAMTGEQRKRVARLLRHLRRQRRRLQRKALEEKKQESTDANAAEVSECSTASTDADKTAESTCTTASTVSASTAVEGSLADSASPSTKPKDI